MGLKADLARPEHDLADRQRPQRPGGADRQRVPFDWLSVGGYNVSGSALGMPDVGLLTLAEQVEAVRRVARTSRRRRSSPTATTATATTSTSSAWCARCSSAGASAIHIEDQVLPKKCGHMEGKRIVPQAEFIARSRPSSIPGRPRTSCSSPGPTRSPSAASTRRSTARTPTSKPAPTSSSSRRRPDGAGRAASAAHRRTAPLQLGVQGQVAARPARRAAPAGLRFLLQADVLYAVSHALRGSISASSRRRRATAPGQTG